MSIKKLILIALLFSSGCTYLQKRDVAGTHFPLECAGDHQRLQHGEEYQLRKDLIFYERPSGQSLCIKKVFDGSVMSLCVISRYNKRVDIKKDTVVRIDGVSPNTTGFDAIDNSIRGYAFCEDIDQRKIMCTVGLMKQFFNQTKAGDCVEKDTLGDESTLKQIK